MQKLITKNRKSELIEKQAYRRVIERTKIYTFGVITMIKIRQNYLYDKKTKQWIPTTKSIKRIYNQYIVFGRHITQFASEHYGSTFSHFLKISRGW